MRCLICFKQKSSSVKEAIDKLNFIVVSWVSILPIFHGVLEEALYGASIALQVLAFGGPFVGSSFGVVFFVFLWLSCLFVVFFTYQYISLVLISLFNES